MPAKFWSTVNSGDLAQGDLFDGCLVPAFGADFGAGGDGSAEAIPVGEQRLIVVTQSCDLENNKVLLVALCPVYSLDEFEENSPAFKKAGQWENVRKGRIEGLHLLGSPTDPKDNRSCLVIDFRQIFSLPPDYLTKKAQSVGTRLRLDSPYLEDFSQAFGRYFMRVALPQQIPKFK